MQFKQFFENTSGKLIICDVQPAFAKAIYFDMREFLKWAQSHQEVVVLFNGPEMGFESMGKIGMWYNQFGVPGNVLRSWRWFEKGYAWFRDLMDSCYMRPNIVKLARYMIKKKVRDWRELTEQDFRILNIPEFNTKITDSYSFYIPDLAYKLRSFNGANICGGGFDECLSEVMILADALNIKLNIVHEWTY